MNGATQPVAQDESPERGWLRLLVDRTFGAFIWGRLLSSTGVWVYSITAAVLTFELTASALMVGLVSVAQFLPQVLLAAVTGSMADRGDRKRQIVVGRVIVIAGAGGLALWLWLIGEGAAATPAVIVASSAVVGIGFVTGGPAQHAMVPALVRPSEIAAAVTLTTAPVTVARAIGPALGAWVAFTLGSTSAFALAALCNFGFLVVVQRLRVSQEARDPDADTSMRAAFAHLKRDPVVRFILIGVAAIGIGTDPAITLAPSLSDAMGHGTSQAGVFATAFGAGAGVAFFVLPAAHRLVGLGWSGSLGLLSLAAGWAAALLVSTPGGAVPVFALAGLGMTMALTSLSALLQQRLPDSLRGRIMALWSVGFLGARPFAAALDGAVADLVSLEAAFVTVALILLAAAWLCRPSKLEGRSERPAGGPPPVSDGA